MKLWTWQGPTWDITSGELNHSKSPYFIHEDAPRIREAYAELNRRLRKKIVWLYTNEREANRPNEDERVQWVLEVPGDKILKFTDGWVWERIIGSGTYPESLRQRWRLDAPETEPGRTEYYERKKAKYLSQSPPRGDWWLELFVTFPPPPSVEMVSALVEHPLEKSWVIKDGRKC